MIALLRLCRLYYALPMSAILALTLWYALGDRIDAHRAATACAAVAVALVIAGGYSLNDYYDRRIDRFNAPHRPLPAGHVTPRAAALWAVVLFSAGLLLALAAGGRFALALAAVVATVVLYDANSKRLGLAKQLTVAALMTSFYPLAFAYAGLPTTARGATLYLFPFWIFLTSFGYETLKDLRDRHGDRLATGRASWVSRRPRLARRVARAALLAGALALLGPAWTGCGWVYRLLVPVPIALGIWAAFLPQVRARIAVYAQFVAVGLAALADIMLVGP